MIMCVFPTQNDCREAFHEMREAEDSFKDFVDLHEAITQMTAVSDDMLIASCNQYQTLLNQWTDSKRRFERFANHYSIYFNGYSLN